MILGEHATGGQVAAWPTVAPHMVTKITFWGVSGRFPASTTTPEQIPIDFGKVIFRPQK